MAITIIFVPYVRKTRSLTTIYGIVYQVRNGRPGYCKTSVLHLIFLFNDELKCKKQNKGEQTDLECQKSI